MPARKTRKKVVESDSEDDVAHVPPVEPPHVKRKTKASEKQRTLGMYLDSSAVCCSVYLFTRSGHFRQG